MESSNPVQVGKFIIHRPLNAGSFGKLFTARLADEKECNYVVKSASLQHAEGMNQMANEIRVYKALQEDGVISKQFEHEIETHFARYFDSGIIESSKDAYLVIDRLDTDLYTLFESSARRKFSLKTTLMIADQMLHALESLHQIGFVHSDIKPNNIVAQRSKPGLKLVDFGLSQPFVDSVTSKHVVMHENNFLRGSARYASLNQHFGFTSARRDDLESLMYTLIFLMKGDLPWQRVIQSDWTKQRKFEAIAQCKVKTSVVDLCQNLDPVFALMLSRCRQMRYDEGIDFSFMRQCIIASCQRNGLTFPFDDVFDWTTAIKPKVTSTSNVIDTTLPVVKTGLNGTMYI